MYKMDQNTLLGTALLASLEAGEEIMRIYNDPEQDFGIERKADNSPLTLADKASHQVIMRHLAGTGIPVLSEEGQHQPYEERAAWERLWVVDPLDGTKEFIKKNGEFTVNVAQWVRGPGSALCPGCGRDFLWVAAWTRSSHMGRTQARHRPSAVSPCRPVVAMTSSR